MQKQEAQNKAVLEMLKELAQGEVIRYGSEVDGDIIYDCLFCDPGNEMTNPEKQHAPTCLVIRARQFLQSLEQPALPISPYTDEPYDPEWGIQRP